MELLDIVDENNNPTGQVAERKEAHKKCLWHRHVSAWIMNEKGQILMQKRSAQKHKNPNKWSKTGGHVDAGETVEHAIAREVKEEVGLDVPQEQIKIENARIFKSTYKDCKYYAYNFTFITNKKMEEYTLQKEEVSAVEYMEIEELEKAKRENNQNFTFIKWDDKDFFAEMEYLKKVRSTICS